MLCIFTDNNIRCQFAGGYFLVYAAEDFSSFRGAENLSFGF